MNTPFLLAKLVLLVMFAFSVVGMIIGFLLAKTSLFLIGVVIAVMSTGSAIRQFGRWLRVSEMERRWLEANGDLGSAGAFDIPERIFVLLCSVAQADGAAGPRERALIRQFVLERFPDAQLAARLASWRAEPLERDQLVVLLRDLRHRLAGIDRETLFHWCCLVALIDERFNQREHEILQTVAQHLGLDAEHARMLFLHAKARVLGERSWRGRGGPRGRHAPPRPSLDRRTQAFEALGLEPGASADQVRKRHRELVKKHHPDTHSHLGPVAQQEATERFRRIQEAYEALNGEH